MKRNCRLKITVLSGLSILILCLIAYGSLRPMNRSPESIQPIITDSLIEPTQGHVPLRDSLVDFGITFLGTPYVPGGCSKSGFDCSGFVYFVFQRFNSLVPRSSSQYRNFGKEIPIDSVQKGDILVFMSPTRNVPGHVGIVTNPKGMESDFIHASSGNEMKVIITSLKKSGYKRRFVKAVSVF